MLAYTDLLSADREISISIEFLELLTVGCHKRDFAVRLWDGTIWGDVCSPRFTLVLNHSGALRSMFQSPNELTLGEAFIYGDFDIEGDMEGMFDFGDFLLNRNYSLVEKLKFARLLAALPEAESPLGRVQRTSLTGSIHSPARDRHAATYHYDVSNDFYSLWLDRSMVYSCAYFRSPEEDLDTAQESKLDYICRKLRLLPGDRLLDLGCGWGGLLIHAAKHFGANAFGITLSVPQAEEARERIRSAGLSEQCRVEVRDYRELDPAQNFDKIVSVGMFEHVGEKLLPEYFQRAWNALRPGGVFLNHGIAEFATFRHRGPSFVDKYVFPDGELIPLNATLRAAEECGFEVRDVESLREHYALTLNHWVRRLEAKAAEAKKIVKDVKYRIWRLYMAGSAHGFVSGRLNLYQVLLGKFGHGHSPLPFTREDWYA